MRRAIEKFLKLRRTAYPSNVMTIRCSEPRNLTDLAIEYCRHPYCQTLILTDHDTGLFSFFFFDFQKVCKNFFHSHFSK